MTERLNEHPPKNNATTNERPQKTNAKLKLGFAMCGSFCTHSHSLGVMKALADVYDITPIISYAAASTDTRFGTKEALVEKIRSVCQNDIISTIVEAEKLAASPLDLMLICPCTGNTAAKLANGITDTPVTMAAKAHVRTDRPLVIALASNDAMSANMRNIGTLMQRKNIYFVPMRQDDIVHKPHSLVADFDKCALSLELAAEGRQARPLFL